MEGTEQKIFYECWLERLFYVVRMKGKLNELFGLRSMIIKVRCYYEEMKNKDYKSKMVKTNEEDRLCDVALSVDYRCVNTNIILFYPKSEG